MTSATLQEDLIIDDVEAERLFVKGESTERKRAVFDPPTFVLD
jgi:hypothetical protein